MIRWIAKENALRVLDTDKNDEKETEGGGRESMSAPLTHTRGSHSFSKQYNWRCV